MFYKRWLDGKGGGVGLMVVAHVKLESSCKYIGWFSRKKWHSENMQFCAAAAEGADGKRGGKLVFAAAAVQFVCMCVCVFGV